MAATPVRKAGKRGAKPPVPLATGTLEDYATGPLPPLPAKVTPPKPAGGWQMFSNDLWSDCTIAGDGHTIMAWATILDGLGLQADAPVIPTDDEVLAVYKALTGAQQPGDAHDDGLVISDVLKLWQSAQGLLGTKILGATTVPFTKHDHLRQAIALCGAVVIGVDLPDSAEQQFESGNNWAYTGDPGTGGHEMLLVGYDGLWIQAVTWGGVVNLGPRWISHYGVEAYAPLPACYQAAGRGLENIDFAALQHDMPALD